MQTTVLCPLWARKNIIHGDCDNDEQVQAPQSVSSAIKEKPYPWEAGESCLCDTSDTHFHTRGYRAVI